MWNHLKAHNVLYSLALVLLVLITGIGTAGYAYYTVIRERVKQQNGNQLSAVVELKVNEISRWRKERLADARVIIETPSIAQLVRRYFEGPAESRPMQELLDWMQPLKDQYDYSSVSLLDVNGIARLSLPEGDHTDDHLPTSVSKAMLTMAPVLCDLERSDAGTDIHLDLVIPLAVTEQAVRSPVGALLIRVDPYKFLYPLIQSWPTPSLTAETLLVRREGDEVVFLNELRHRKSTALSMRLSMSQLEAPAVKAVEGKEGILDGVDYRGSSVLAAARHVPDTSWFLIAKMDKDEIYAPARDRLLVMTFLVILMIAGAAVTVGMIWWYQRSKIYLRQYKTEAEKLELAQRYEHLTRHANDSILLVREDGRIAEANQRAAAAYGRTDDELLDLSIKDLETDGTAPPFEELTRQARQQDGFVFETVHRRKDGTTFPVEISMRAVRLMENNFCLMIIRDVTERKLAEKALKEAHYILERRVLERTADLQTMNERLRREIEVRTRAEEDLRAVTVRLAETEESERRRLARELHDRVGQNLTALNFNISVVMNGLPAESHAEGINRLEDSLNLVADTITCVRDVMSELRPPLLDDYGLAAVLGWYSREFSERSGIAAAVECAGDFPRLPLSVEMALFRIAQEALMNVMRHARAGRVTIELKATAEAARMVITDNGVGFIPETMGSPRTQQSGWGMLSMRERAEMAGGRLAVSSVPGGGACITTEVAR
jgi:PAS domain S-box-containing protein